MAVNVKEHGAVGDGKANDTTAIQTAIAVLPAAGGVVLFPAGTYLVTPGAPAFSVGSGVVLEGEGHRASVIKSINNPAAEGRFFDIGGGRVEFRDLSFAGPATFGGPKIVTAVRATNVAGIEVCLRNCGAYGMNRVAQMWSGQSQTIEMLGCDFDAEDIGNKEGAAQDASNCVLGPNVGGGVIARDCRFRRWGSNTTEGSNKNHVLYLCNETPLLVDGCRFEEHRDGRYIQVNGSAEGAPTAGNYWMIGNSFFGKQVVQNIAVQTSPSIRGTVADCEFKTDKTSIEPQGDVMICACTFKGGAANTFYTIQMQAPSCKVEVRDCAFLGSTEIDIYLLESSCELDVSDCEFRESSSYAHICTETGKTGTEIRVSDCLFKVKAGATAIRHEAGTVAYLRIQGAVLKGGQRGLFLVGGSTVTLLALQSNHLFEQSTAGVTKSGTVTTETSLGNIGYSDVSFGSVASAETISLPAGRLITVTGTTGIKSIAATSRGDERTLLFSGALTVTDGSNLKLASNFVTTGDDTLSLVCDGTNWYEKGRSVN
jgi:hypothetical protein